MKLQIMLAIIMQLFLSNCVSTKKIAENKNDGKPKYGPFQDIVTRSEHCTNVSLPYEKNPSGVFYAEMYNTTNKINLLRGNFTTIRAINRKHWLRFRGYQWKKEKWQLKYYFNNIPCDGIISTSLVKLMGFKIDNTCNLPPSKTFTFKGIDFNQVDHLIWSAGREYGRLLWITEVYTRINTILCWATEVLSIPA